MKRCSQINCGFYLQGGCRNCDDCKTEPYYINENCRRCIDCENVPNSLRWGDMTNSKIALPRKIKVITREPILEEDIVR